MQLDVRFDAADDHGIFDGETAHYTFSSDTLVVRTDADPRRFEKLALHAVKEEGSEDPGRRMGDVPQRSASDGRPQLVRFVIRR